MDDVVSGDGYAVAGSLAALGDGPGFRKVRQALGVTAFGVNAIVLPHDYATSFHAHEEQEELYFVHSGEIEIEFGDGSSHHIGPGGMARVDPATPRRVRNVGSGGGDLPLRRRQGRLRRSRRQVGRTGRLLRR